MKHRLFASKRSADERPVPPVLPLIVLEEYGKQLVLTVNGDKATTQVVERDHVGARISELVAEFGSATRVEVHEEDGTVHADILQPPPKPKEPEDDTEAQPEEPGEPEPDKELIGLDGDGFIPGEEVAVAVLVRFGSADEDGHARMVLSREDLAATNAQEAMLFGRVSETATVRRLT